MIYKINLALVFLGSGKNDLQNQLRSCISRLGKNDLQNQPRSCISRLGKK